MSTPHPPGLIARTIFFDPAEMARRGRKGGRTTVDRGRMSEIARAGREAFLRQLADAADPDHALPEDERMELAREAQRDHLRRINRISVERRTAETAGAR